MRSSWPFKNVSIKDVAWRRGCEVGLKARENMQNQGMVHVYFPKDKAEMTENRYAFRERFGDQISFSGKLSECASL